MRNVSIFDMGYRAVKIKCKRFLLIFTHKILYIFRRKNTPSRVN